MFISKEVATVMEILIADDNQQNASILGEYAKKKVTLLPRLLMEKTHCKRRCALPLILSCWMS